MGVIVSSFDDTSVELAAVDKNIINISNMSPSDTSRMKKKNTHDTMAHHTTAIEPTRSLYNTMDTALRHRHYGNNSQHFVFVEKHSVAENVSVASVDPTSDTQFPSA